nr:MAG TPA: hypothetical protein [Caudoviricetes sp.]
MHKRLYSLNEIRISLEKYYYILCIKRLIIQYIV